MELKLDQVPIGITVTVAKINGKMWKRLKMKEKAKKKKYKRKIPRLSTNYYKLPNTLTTHTSHINTNTNAEKMVSGVLALKSLVFMCVT